LHTAGGKGINMARAFITLGGRDLCMGIIGGHAGRYVIDELDREGIAHDMILVDTETRRSSTIFSEGQSDVTVILEPGQPVEEPACDQLGERVLLHADEAPYLVLVGSLPPGFPIDFYATLIQRSKGKSAKVCLDCSGEALSLAARAGPALIKVNKKEICQAFGLNMASSDWGPVREVFDQLLPFGVRMLIITDGQRGANVFSSDNPPFHVFTRVETWVSSAGAGDSFMAGLVLSLGRGERLEDAACYASSVASANLQQVGCGFLEIADVERFLNQTDIRYL
jgi:tagatose 6-phosphate kinase